MHRVRLVLPYLRVHGVNAEVLCVDADQVAAPQDSWLAAGLPPDVAIFRVKALGLKWGRLPGLGALAFRALSALRRRGDALLRDGRFDLVYFSTTQFGVHVLGPHWHRKFGVPFSMDYQDPWVSDYYDEHPEVVPPGGRLKYGVMSWINRRQEPRVLRECRGITSVSASYPEQLASRYPWLEIRSQRSEITNIDAEVGVSDIRLPTSAPHPMTSNLRLLTSLILPFPGDVRDFERVKKEGIRQSVFETADGLKHWVYVGRSGADMAMAVRGFFSAIQSTLNKPTTLNSLRLHFIGTSYAAAGTGTKVVEPLAADYGLSEIVHEYTDRIPYSEALCCLLDADALVVLGSDDPAYTASKIYPYLLAEKPLLAVFHEQSSVVDLIRKVGGGTVIPFATGDDPDAIAARIASEWLDNGGPKKAVPLDHTAFAPYTAREQARQLAEFFSGVSGRARSGMADPSISNPPR